MKAARILDYKKPLVFADIPIPDIQADEVLVKVEACGMCRSDVLLVDGFFQNYASIPPPVIPGHEIAGTITKVGSVIPKAASLSEGDHVVVAPGWGDGVCRHCQVGNTQHLPQCALARLWDLRRLCGIYSGSGALRDQSGETSEVRGARAASPTRG